VSSEHDLTTSAALEDGDDDERSGVGIRRASAAAEGRRVQEAGL
jgi:hypothetical protein